MDSMLGFDFDAWGWNSELEADLAKEISDQAWWLPKRREIIVVKQMEFKSQFENGVLNPDTPLHTITAQLGYTSTIEDKDIDEKVKEIVTAHVQAAMQKHVNETLRILGSSALSIRLPDLKQKIKFVHEASPLDDPNWRDFAMPRMHDYFNRDWFYGRFASGGPVYASPYAIFAKPEVFMPAQSTKEIADSLQVQANDLKRLKAKEITAQDYLALYPGVVVPEDIDEAIKYLEQSGETWMGIHDQFTKRDEE